MEYADKMSLVQRKATKMFELLEKHIFQWQHQGPQTVFNGQEKCQSHGSLSVTTEAEIWRQKLFKLAKVRFSVS